MAKYFFALFLSLFILDNIGLSAATTDEGWTVSGTVVNGKNKKKIEGAGINVIGNNVGTVTNADGYFMLKFPHEVNECRLVVEKPGFRNDTLYVEANIGQPLFVRLAPTSKTLEEITVHGGDARTIVEEAFKRIQNNYPREKNLFSAFYRETVQKGNRYIAISEAMADVMKTPYTHYSTAGDKVQIRKGRRLLSQKASDTIAVKMVGGPTSAVVLDFVKNHDALFAPDELKFYYFKLLDQVIIDERPQFVIGFKPIFHQDYVMMEGALYIDRETLALTRGEYNMEMSDKDKATRAILIKKPRGLRFTPQEASYTVTYKRGSDGRSRINYIRAKMRFKCDWKRRLFSSGYTTVSELVMVDREDSPTEGISRKNAFGKRDIFYDMVEDYWDENFWNDYNIIEPSESLEKAVRKLKKK